jgi:long-chain acyl-CoA synthetase
MTFEANLVRAVQSTIRHNRHLPAIIDTDCTFTWMEFGERIGRLAGALRSMGISSETRFAVLSRNGFRMEELKWSGLWIRAIPVPINWRLAPPEIAHILQDADCQHIFAETEFCENFKHASLAGWSDKLTDFGRASGRDAPRYETILQEFQPVDPANPDPDDDAILLYTGGTTGRSKGVRLSHANILSNALGLGLGVGARRQQVYLHVIPMFHSGDLLATAWLLQGAPQCYLPTFSAQAFLETIQRHRIGAVCAVPTMWIDAVRHPKFSNFDLSSLRVLMYGAAPTAIEWIERIAIGFPDADLFNTYGLTEATPILTIFDAKEFRDASKEARWTGRRRAALSSVGKPNLLSELRIVGRDGREVRTGDIGEIVARGPNIMKGYLNQPDATAAAMQDGWLRTGDIGRIDEDGYVYLLDRLKDVVISGGENVYSSEVEGVLHRHPAVAEAAVIGVPDERLGETVMAVIVPATGERPTEDQLARHCREWLGGFKVPRKFAFVNALPRSALGKVLKATLRGQFGADCGQSRRRSAPSEESSAMPAH